MRSSSCPISIRQETVSQWCQLGVCVQLVLGEHLPPHKTSHNLCTSNTSHLDPLDLPSVGLLESGIREKDLILLSSPPPQHWHSFLGCQDVLKRFQFHELHLYLCVPCDLSYQAQIINHDPLCREIRLQSKQSCCCVVASITTTVQKKSKSHIQIQCQCQYQYQTYTIIISISCHSIYYAIQYVPFMRCCMVWHFFRDATRQMDGPEWLD